MMMTIANVISRHCTKSPTILPLNTADTIEEETYLIGNNITNNKICNEINRPYIYIRQMTNYGAACTVISFML